MQATAPAQVPQAVLATYARFEDIVDLIRAQRDAKLLIEVETCLRLVSYSPGRITFEPTPDAPMDLASRLGQSLQAWTGARWGVSVAGSGGGATLSEIREEETTALKAAAEKHPLVKAVFAAFPQAEITDITPPADLAAQAAENALPEVEEEWDPFEDD
ncbi:hypothetical protein CCR78_03345 [Rhodovulum imhoffii]|nr:hypothetical protein [Rhodovulum imhoffii]